jgi:threonine/homoserine/homoserine lactone efflux protein
MLYPLFLLMAATTVLSPGPGVLMTLTNSLRFGMRGTFGGIVGIALGALVVAAISATGLGVLLAASATAYTVMKYLGAAYLFYLGIRLWRSPAVRIDDSRAVEVSFRRRFLEGLSLQLTNPKAIFFFLSVFPQFIRADRPYAAQFATLVLSYSALVLFIHSGYALTAQRVRRWLTSEHGARTLNRLGGATFCCFGAAMATARR